VDKKLIESVNIIVPSLEKPSSNSSLISQTHMAFMIEGIKNSLPLHIHEYDTAVLS
jgi:hypothetical protein